MKSLEKYLSKFLDKNLTARQYTFLASEGYSAEELELIKSTQYNSIMQEIKKSKSRVHQQKPTEKQINFLKERDYDTSELENCNRWVARKTIMSILEDTKENPIFLEKLKVVKKDNGAIAK